ncbi:MAG: CDP-diacylglycerol--glycerol-3-phosphate 3-phosphatidyltransferase [Bdellovibrionales bacterium]
MMWTLPNILTMGRIVVLPLMFACFYLEGGEGAMSVWVCFGLYVLAALTDFFDGYFARKLNQISAFGTFLDPISDKIFVGCLLVLLVAFGRLEDLWIIPVLVILFREFLVSGLREFLGPHNVKLPVTQLAKWKTTLQMVALGVLILAPVVPYTLLIGQISLAGAAILTVVTGWGYMKTGWNFMKTADRQK